MFRKNNTQTIQVSFYDANTQVFIKNGEYTGTTEEIQDMMERDRAQYNLLIKKGHAKVAVARGRSHKKQW